MWQVQVRELRENASVGPYYDVAWHFAEVRETHYLNDTLDLTCLFIIDWF